MDLSDFLRKQKIWSRRIFGPGNRDAGLIDHIRKELKEIAAAPGDLSEWIDVIILALDGAWRNGHSVEEICRALEEKQRVNAQRTWPDWKTAPMGKAIEHDRSVYVQTGGRATRNPDAPVIDFEHDRGEERFGGKLVENLVQSACPTAKQNKPYVTCQDCGEWRFVPEWGGNRKNTDEWPGNKCPTCGGIDIVLTMPAAAGVEPSRPYVKCPCCGKKEWQNKWTFGAFCPDCGSAVQFLIGDK